MTTPKDSASIEARTEKDFENSLEYWRDLANMLREELKAALRSVEPAKIVLPDWKTQTQECADLLLRIKRLNAGAAFKIEGE